MVTELTIGLFCRRLTYLADAHSFQHSDGRFPNDIKASGVQDRINDW